jgi:hypothetical protein
MEREEKEYVCKTGMVVGKMLMLKKYRNTLTTLGGRYGTGGPVRNVVERTVQATRRQSE